MSFSTVAFAEKNSGRCIHEACKCAVYSGRKSAQTQHVIMYNRDIIVGVKIYISGACFVLVLC